MSTNMSQYGEAAHLSYQPGSPSYMNGSHGPPSHMNFPHGGPPMNYPRARAAMRQAKQRQASQPTTGSLNPVQTFDKYVANNDFVFLVCMLLDNLHRLDHR